MLPRIGSPRQPGTSGTARQTATLAPIGSRLLRDRHHRRAAPPLRHPETASERSAGRRIRDPCLAAHSRDPVHDEVRAADRRRRPSAGPAPRPLPSSRSSPHPPASRPPSVVASRRHLRPHCVGWRTDCHQRRRPSSNPTQWGEVPSAARRRGDPAAPSRDGERSARRTWRGLPSCSRASAARGSPARPARPDRPPPLRPSAAGCSATSATVAPPLRFVIPERRPSVAQDGVSGIHASPPMPAIRCTTRPPTAGAVPPPAPLHGRDHRHDRRRIHQRRAPPSVVASRRHLRPHCVGWRTDRGGAYPGSMPRRPCPRSGAGRPAPPQRSFTVSIATKVEVCATWGSAEMRSPSTRR